MLASARLGKKFDLNGHTAVDWARYLIFVLGMEIGRRQYPTRTRPVLELRLADQCAAKLVFYVLYHPSEAHCFSGPPLSTQAFSVIRLGN